MEHLRAGKCQKSKVTPPEEPFSILPEDVITNILDCLPIKDAVRTSILSRNWMYKWTDLTQLVFDKKFVEKFKNGRSFVAGRIISRLLLHIKGGIRKFVLHVPYGSYYSKIDFDDINSWVKLLSSKGLREFTLENINAQSIELSTHLLFCTNLEHLTLHNCYFRGMKTFLGFPKLLTLKLNRVRFIGSRYGDLITSCTLLEVLELHSTKPTDNVKFVEIAKLENLKVLSLALCEFDDPKVTTWDIFRLMASLQKLQNLTLDFRNFKYMEETNSGNRVSSGLPSLTSLSLHNLNLNNRSMVLFAFDLIRCSLYLQTLNINLPHWNPSTSNPVTSSEVDVECSMLGNLKQLRIVEYRFSTKGEIELCLIKSLLTYCSSLKKMVIYYSELQHKRWLDFVGKLNAFPRASPMAEIDFVNT